MQHWGQRWRTTLMLWGASLLMCPSSSQITTSTRHLDRRQLEDVDYSYFEYDLSQFSVRFQKCQFVKMYDDELAQDEDSTTVLAAKQFVIFSLCDSSTCASCRGAHGEYALDLYDYLDATIEFHREQFEYMCQNCNEQCGDNSDNCDEDGCVIACYQYDNLEANGFVDATDYLECQQIEQNEDSSSSTNSEQEESDDDKAALYIGPKCTGDTNRIVIGLFSDENCWEPYTEQSVQDVLGMKLSYVILKHSYMSGDGTKCLSCDEQDGNNNANDNADADDVNEMCENLYYASAKCETPYGIEAGFIQTKQKDGEYENQVENEYMACAFVNNIKANSYTETGEIDSVSEQDEVIRLVTSRQVAALSFLVAALLGLGCYGYWLDRYIDNKYPPKVDLSSQTDNELT